MPRTPDGMRNSRPTIEHLTFREDLLAVLQKHSAILPADQCLAIAAYTVGQIIAMQDQRKMTPAMAFELVAQNIELGNRDAIEGLLASKGSA